MLSFGALIVLAVITTACSGQAPSTDDQPDLEVVNHNIKVYESPT